MEVYGVELVTGPEYGLVAVLGKLTVLIGSSALNYYLKWNFLV